jgi:hypothetical protein
MLTTLSRIQWIVWTFIFLLIFLVFLQTDAFPQSLTYAAITTLFYIITIYGNAGWLIPRFYERGRRTLYVISAILFLVLLTYLRVALQTFIYNRFFAAPDMPAKPPTLRVYLPYGFSTILIFIFSIAYYFSMGYFKVRKRTAEAELKLLKSQVQPHFLFNTLNNIYFVAQRESPDTAALLERLSNIMRYFVDEGPKDTIFLTTELGFIYDYIHLEKMRMRHPLKVDFEVAGEVTGLLIPPMLLIPLIENVFKHGIDKRQEDNFLSATLTISENALALRITNRIYEVSSSPGSGISNLKARLELLYGQRFMLTTDKKENLFYAYLNIPL